MKREGGFAYPGTIGLPEGGEMRHGGMTAREVVAMAALQGMLSGSEVIPGYQSLVRNAFAVADAFIAESSK